ncbi:hypothetical protein P245_19615 [Comamonas thiooxydans]|uniref:Uncharacterized protein n=1 Tax=Comamonas thiooxydans TaxID=363952 RepID=A0A0E3BAD8_9BURK|nr:hypothetical protein P245_19615 [Comamonas thiooxydans]
MTSHTVVIQRSATGSHSSNSLVVDAVNGLYSIPGVLNVEVVKEADSQVTLAYEWDGGPQFEQTDEYLAFHHVQRDWSK